MSFERKRQPLVLPGDTIDYKNQALLHKLVNPQGKILPRRRIGCDIKTQHEIKKAIHRARYLAFLGYGD